MVILCFPDGHTERHPDRILKTDFAHTEPTQVINILTPEEITLYNAGSGMAVDVGYNDPRKENC